MTEAGQPSAPRRVFHASWRKRGRGAILIAGVLAAGAWLVYEAPPLDFRSLQDVALIAATWTLFLWIAAFGIERLFEPEATLACRPEGLVLFPDTHPDRVIAWSDIRRFEVFRFGKSRRAKGFLVIVVDDPRIISRHLPLYLKAAYRLDRWAAGGNRYFRSPVDFTIPVAQVVEELETWRETWRTRDGN